MSDISIDREFYHHESDCTKKDTDFEPMNARGLRRCKQCSGMFDVEGKGVAVTDKRFDERPLPGDIVAVEEM